MNTQPKPTQTEKELIEAAVQYAYDTLSLEYNTLAERMVCEEVEKALWLVLDYVGANDQQVDEGFDPYAADEKDWRDG